MHERNTDLIDIETLFLDACDKHQKGQLNESRSILENLLKAAPKHFDSLHLLGIIAVQQNDFQIAADLLARAIELNPINAAYHSNLGLALQNRMQFEAAIGSYSQAIAIKPDYAEAHYNRGVAFQSLGRLDSAVADYETAISLRPNYAEAYCNRGVVLQKLGMPQEAVVSYEFAIAIRPTYALAFSNRGLALRELNQLNEAVASCDRAIAIMPNLAEAHYNRSIALRELNQLNESVMSYDRAIAIKPDYVEAHFNRGNALMELKQLDGAIVSYDRAIGIKSDYAEANWNKGLALLLAGDFELGLELYEWRWKKDGATGPTERFAKPLWTGCASLSGKSILVYSEQGLGDTILFCRYLSKLSDLGATVLFSPQKSLRGILKCLTDHVRVVPIVDELDAALEFDYHIPLLSLPLAFQTSVSSIPASVPYLFAEKDRVARWNETIGTEGFKIGICWHGATSSLLAGRSFHVENFRNISKIEGVRLISLHKGAGVAQLTDPSTTMRVETLGDVFDSGPDAFMDTAAVMQLCDLVITSDTAIAHMAGALGVPVWVVLKFVPDWRWMLDRDDSPWYPTMRLFRQKSHGDWAGPFSEIEKEVKRQMALLR
jgi:tetratricopeptide (TPR) repeat protein